MRGKLTLITFALIFFSRSYADSTDYSRHRDLIPHEPFHFGNHRLNVGVCSVYRWLGENHIIVRKETTRRDGSAWHEIISFDLPYDLTKPVVWNGTNLNQVAEMKETDDRSVHLNYDISQYYRDTFGYYVRHQVMVQLNPNGTLHSVLAKELESNHRFIVAGPFKPFEIKKQIECHE